MKYILNIVFYTQIIDLLYKNRTSLLYKFLFVHTNKNCNDKNAYENFTDNQVSIVFVI